MDIREIQEYLPHRYPFLLIDRVLEVKPMDSIHAIKNISINEPQFNGHFPHAPIFPGVLIVEALAQAAGILGFKSAGKKATDGSLYLFAGADNVRFKKPVVPGDQLHLHAKYVTHKRGIWKFECEAKVDGHVVARASITSAERTL